MIFYCMPFYIMPKNSMIKKSLELSVKKEPFFPSPLGLLGKPDHIHQNICLKPWRGFIFGPYAHFLLMKFFSKNLNFFFDFLKIQRGDPLDKKKSKKIFKFFEKKFINKKCAYGPKMKPRQGFRQIF